MSRHHNLYNTIMIRYQNVFNNFGFYFYKCLPRCPWLRFNALPVLVLDFLGIACLIYLYTSLFITATVYTISAHIPYIYLNVYYIPIPPT